MDQTIIDMDMRPTLLADENGTTWVDMGQGQAGLAMALAIDAVKDKRLRNLAKLSESIDRTGGAFPKLAGTLPTIGAASASTAIATGTTWQPYMGGAVQDAAKFTMIGGLWGPHGATFPNNQIASAIVAHQGDGTDNTVGPIYGGRVRFLLAAPSFELQIQAVGSTTGAGCRLKVDGEYVKDGTFATDGNGLIRFYPITWGAGAAADRKMRCYELEMNGCRFVGIRTTNLYKPAPWPVAGGLRVIHHGDSIVGTVVDAGNKDNAKYGVMGKSLPQLLGQPDHWPSGTGGAGWFTPTSHLQSWFNDRVTLDIASQSPDIIIEHGGGNDESLLTAGTVNQATYEAAVTQWVQTVIAANPAVLIFMVGPIVCNSGAALGHTRCRDWKKNVALLFPQNVAFIDNILDPWVSGTGREGATAGDGNKDWVCGSDNAHPTVDGHAYLAQRVAYGVARAIPALVAANS